MKNFYTALLCASFAQALFASMHPEALFKVSDVNKTINVAGTVVAMHEHPWGMPSLADRLIERRKRGLPLLVACYYYRVGDEFHGAAGDAALVTPYFDAFRARGYVQMPEPFLRGFVRADRWPHYYTVELKKSGKYAISCSNEPEQSLLHKEHLSVSDFRELSDYYKEQRQWGKAAHYALLSWKRMEQNRYELEAFLDDHEAAQHFFNNIAVIYFEKGDYRKSGKWADLARSHYVLRRSRQQFEAYEKQDLSDYDDSFDESDFSRSSQESESSMSSFDSDDSL